MRRQPVAPTSAQWQHRTRNRELRRRLKVESLDQLVAARKLRWAGHIARMGHERLPRRFLTSWVRNPRPHGRPQFTFGHSLNKTLEWAGISTDLAVWSELAAHDRPAWRELILATAEYPPLPPQRRGGGGGGARQLPGPMVPLISRPPKGRTSRPDVPRRAGVLAPGPVPFRMKHLHGAGCNPSPPHTHAQTLPLRPTPG